MLITEKYRPRTFADIVPPQGLKEKFNKWKADGKLDCHLIFYGNAGTGKSSTAKAILNELDITDVMRVNGSDNTGVDDARQIIKDSQNELNQDIEKMFQYNDYDMDFTINFGENHFPDKAYKGVIYNEGDYESLVVYIGEASGDNWWCILFPSICLTEENANYESIFKNIFEKIFY